MYGYKVIQPGHPILNKRIIFPVLYACLHSSNFSYIKFNKLKICNKNRQGMLDFKQSIFIHFIAYKQLFEIIQDKIMGPGSPSIHMICF